MSNTTTNESNGYNKFATALLSLFILGAYIAGALWLIDSGNLFYQTIGVLAIIVASLILNAAIMKGVVNNEL